MKAVRAYAQLLSTNIFNLRSIVRPFGYMTDLQESCIVQGCLYLSQVSTARVYRAHVWGLIQILSVIKAYQGLQ